MKAFGGPTEAQDWIAQGVMGGSVRVGVEGFLIVRTAVQRGALGLLLLPMYTNGMGNRL